MHIRTSRYLKSGNFRRNWPKCIALMLIVGSLTASSARADSCFRVGKEASSDEAKRHSTSRRVTLASPITVDASCEYTFDPAGVWHGDLAEHKNAESDFATLTLKLRAKGPAGGLPARPTSIFARKKSGAKGLAGAQIESIFLAGCTEYLLSTGRAFSLTVPVETQQPTISRGSGTDTCGASGLTLYFNPIDERTAPEVVRGGPWPNSLSRDKRDYTLKPGRWAIYGARSGSDIGYLVGRINSGSSYTPLRAGLLARKMASASNQGQWLRASWATGPLRFEPTSEKLRGSDLWAELRTAAAADALWLAKGTSEENAEPLGRLLLAENGNSIALPSSSVSEVMQRRYGPAGKYLVPTYEDWSGLRDDLQVCLAPRYESTRLASAGMVRLPTGSTCSALASLSAPLEAQLGGAAATGQICVRRRMAIMTSDGVKTQQKTSETCTPLPLGVPAESRSDFILAVTGDDIRYTGKPVLPLSMCADNQCQPLPADLWLPLRKSGLLEIRSGATAEQALASQGLTLLRLGVIDLATAWHPVGLYDPSDKPAADRWAELERDEPNVFTYLRRRHRLDFHLAVSPALTAAWNARADLPSQITEKIPVVGGVKGSFPGAKPSTFTAVVTRTAECPKDNAADLREKPLVDPENLLVDERFYVHLVQYQGEDKPYQCFARAGFRVAPRRSLSLVPQIRAGLFGDTQLMVFLTNRAALGVAQPLAYVYWRLVYGLGVDVSASLTAAGTFSKKELSRTGLGLSAAAVWGPEQDLPRLVSVGGMLHLATGTAGKQPIGSIFIACNLSSVFDIAGGR
jgi:hypothetical protein